MILKFFFLPVALCAGTVLSAECAPHLDQFLYCKIEGGQKEIEVCFDGEEASYRFGPIGGSPELELNYMISDGADYRPWKGIGQAISEAIDFRNGDFTYSAFGGFDRLTAADDTVESSFGGIRVYEGTEVIANFSCIAETVEWVY